MQKPKQDELSLLLRCCNVICEQRKLPTLYKHAKQGGKVIKAASAEPLTQPSAISRRENDHSDHFHFSIGWQLEEPTERQMDFEGVSPTLLEEVRNIRVKIESVKVKIGNTISSVTLRRSKPDDSRSILG